MVHSSQLTINEPDHVYGDESSLYYDRDNNDPYFGFEVYKLNISY